MPIEDADAQHIVTLSVNAADGSMFSQDEDDLFTAGSTVNVTVTPNGENSVRGIVVTAEDGTKVDCALQGRVYPTEAGKTVYTINSPVIYQFTMPAQAVTVAAEFWDYDSVPRGCTPIDQNNFPDNAFRGYVLEYLDTNGDGLPDSNGDAESSAPSVDADHASKNEPASPDADAANKSDGSIPFIPMDPDGTTAVAPLEPDTVIITTHVPSDPDAPQD